MSATNVCDWDLYLNTRRRQHSYIVLTGLFFLTVSLCLTSLHIFIFFICTASTCCNELTFFLFLFCCNKPLFQEVAQLHFFLMVLFHCEVYTSSSPSPSSSSPYIFGHTQTIFIDTSVKVTGSYSSAASTGEIKSLQTIDWSKVFLNWGNNNKCGSCRHHQTSLFSDERSLKETNEQLWIYGGWRGNHNCVHSSHYICEQRDSRSFSLQL